MIYILSILCFNYTADPVTIVQTSAHEVVFEVVFDQQQVQENKAITRFLLSSDTPVVEYEITGSALSDHPSSDGFNCQPVLMGTPFSIRGHTLYPVHMFPNYLKDNMIITPKSIRIKAHTYFNEPVIELPPAFAQVFNGLVLNSSIALLEKPQEYLIIVPDALYNDILPLATWKEKKGWHVVVATLSQTGGTPNSIKNYIASAYNDSLPTEYVLLVGDHNLLPAHSTATPVSYTDHPYTMIDGSDFLSDVFIGRLPCANASELATMLNKIITYETDPYMADPSWFDRALVVAANYPINIMTTPIPTKRLIRERLLEYGFNEVDTVYYPPVSGGAEITAAINQGVTLVNYRGGDADPDGWIHPNFHNTEVTGLSNGEKLPIVTSIVCLNGNFGYATCFGEAWLRAGNVVNPRGAVAFFGASAATTSSRWNNCLDMGIYVVITQEHISSLAPAMYRGKLEVYMNFPLDTSWTSGTSFYFHTYNILGDPSLQMWTTMPDTFVVSHDATLPTGASVLAVQVQSASMQPVERALVSLYKEGEVKEVVYTDAAGNAYFTFKTTSNDTLFVTVSKKDFKPYCGHCLITSSSVYVGYDSHTIDDGGGNNNGEINPGEPIDLGVTLRNYGTSTTATNVTALLRANDPYVTITDSSKSYGSIPPGNTATSSPFAFTVAANTPHAHQVRFTLAISSSQGSWDGGLTLPVFAPECSLLYPTIVDGNGVLEPGETSPLTITLQNNGGLTGQNVTGVLRSHNPAVTVVDAASLYAV